MFARTDREEAPAGRVPLTAISETDDEVVPEPCLRVSAGTPPAGLGVGE